MSLVRRRACSRASACMRFTTQQWKHGSYQFIRSWQVGAACPSDKMPLISEPSGDEVGMRSQQQWSCGMLMIVAAARRGASDAIARGSAGADWGRTQMPSRPMWKTCWLA